MNWTFLFYILTTISIHVRASEKYKVLNISKLTWSMAKKACSDNGMTLAEIHSEQDQKNLAKVIESNPSGLQYLWTGGKIENPDDLKTYKWSSSQQEMDFTDWANDPADFWKFKYRNMQPLCVILDSKQNFKWNTWPCSSKTFKNKFFMMTVCQEGKSGGVEEAPALEDTTNGGIEGSGEGSGGGSDEGSGGSSSGGSDGGSGEGEVSTGKPDDATTKNEEEGSGEGSGEGNASSDYSQMERSNVKSKRGKIKKGGKGKKGAKKQKTGKEKGGKKQKGGKQEESKQKENAKKKEKGPSEDYESEYNTQDFSYE